MSVRPDRRAIYSIVKVLALSSVCVALCRADEAPPAVERGNTPWVFRSVLDQRPRMITLALSKTLWAAYDTQNAALYKVWRDGVEFDGAVYTTRHGPQPSAQGAGYIVNDVPMPWRVIAAGREFTPEVQYLGHRFANGHAYLRYALRYGDAQEIVLEELPEAVAGKGSGSGFFRRYEIISNPTRAQVVSLVVIQSLDSRDDIQTDGGWSVEKVSKANGMLSVRGRLTLRSRTTTLVATFSGAPGVAPPEKKVASDPGARLIEQSDCSSCHNVVDETVGPSYGQIARHYQTTPGNIEMLAQKIISGGAGVWGEVPMSPHPTLSLEQTRIMVAYILGLDKSDTTDEYGLMLEAPTEASSELPRELPPGLQAGVTLRYYEIADAIQGLPLIEQEQLPSKISVVPSLRLTSFPPYRPGDVGFDEFKKKRKFVIHASGQLHAPVAGEYRLGVWDSYGDSRFFVGSHKVAETHGLTWDTYPVQLAAGWHPFTIEYASASTIKSSPDSDTFLNMLMLTWRPPGQAESLVPPAALATEVPDLAAVAPGPKSYVLTSGPPGDLLPLQDVHPAFKLVAIRPESFKPKVAGMDFLPDGRLVLSTWSAEGGVYVLDGIRGSDPGAVTVKQIASGLAEPLGLKVVDGRIYVLQKQELTELIDHDGDEVIDEYRLVSNRWSVTDNFHEFAFGLVYENGYFYATLASAVMPGGAPAQPQSPDRGKVVRIDRKTGVVETVARGLRTPNGVGFGVDGEIFVADNQGNWLPASKIVHVQDGAFYGFREVDPAHDKDLPETPPVVWLPQEEIGLSPTSTIPFDLGPYKGQMLNGDVSYGGLQRVFVEKIAGAYQGCAFRFSQGFEAGVNRTVWGPDGALYVGGIGNPGNWGQFGKLHYGLQKLVPTGQDAFEMLAIRVKSNGIEIEFTQPLRPGDGLRPEDYQVRQWRYVPTQEYGGPKVDEEGLAVRSVSLSQHRRRAFLELPGMKAGHVLYVHIATPFIAPDNRDMWSTESWCTVNAIPANDTGMPGKAAPANALTPEERQAGWRMLFDGKTTQGWRNFNKPGLDKRWRAEEGALTLAAQGGGDIVSQEQFASFELKFEWKIAPGGNSGVFFHVREGKYGDIWRTGPEMQILDDDLHPDGRLPSHRAGANYDLDVPRYLAAKPVGEFNAVRLLVDHGHVEHWLNGRKVVEYNLWTDEWRRKVAASKFASMPDYGLSRSGHIAFQDHGDRVWFRNIKIRPLTGASP